MSVSRDNLYVIAQSYRGSQLALFREVSRDARDAVDQIMRDEWEKLLPLLNRPEGTEEAMNILGRWSYLPLTRKFIEKMEIDPYTNFSKLLLPLYTYRDYDSIKAMYDWFSEGDDLTDNDEETINGLIADNLDETLFNILRPYEWMLFDFLRNNITVSSLDFIIRLLSHMSIYVIISDLFMDRSGKLKHFDTNVKMCRELPYATKTILIERLLTDAQYIGDHDTNGQYPDKYLEHDYTIKKTLVDTLITDKEQIYTIFRSIKVNDKDPKPHNNIMIQLLGMKIIEFSA